jgi:NAD(P)-dependent dehydrogenase (short-subunit alcohol dehydrogenase family)
MFVFLIIDKITAKAKEHKGQISYYCCDITNAEGIHTLFEKATSNLRYPLRGLVCCAGVSGESPAVDYPIESFRRIVDINLSGTFICAQAAARVFCRQKIGGSVVLIASISGHVSNKVSSLHFQTNQQNWH